MTGRIPWPGTDLRKQASDGDQYGDRLLTVPARPGYESVGAKRAAARQGQGQADLDSGRRPAPHHDDLAIRAGQDRIVRPDVLRQGRLQHSPRRDRDLIFGRQVNPGTFDHRQEKRPGRAFQQGHPASLTGLAHGPAAIAGDFDGRPGVNRPGPRIQRVTAHAPDVRAPGCERRLFADPGGKRVIAGNPGGRIRLPAEDASRAVRRVVSPLLITEEFGKFLRPVIQIAEIWIN